MRRGLAVSACWTAILATRTVSADEAEPLRIEYHVAPSCPSEAEFVAEVRAHTTRWRDAIGAEQARHFVIDVAARGKTMHGRLALTDLADGSAVRELDGATCDVVVETLALMTALAIDPQASLAPIPQPAPAPAPTPTAAPPVLLQAKAPTHVLNPAAPEPSASWQLAVGAHADATGGAAPVLLYGMRAFVEASVRRPSVVSPGARLLVNLSESASIPTSEGTAHFRRLLGGVELCPLRLPLGTPLLTFVPCAAFELGALYASGSDTPRALNQTRLWIAAGATGRVEWALGRRVAFEAEGGALLPFARDRFRFPALAVYDVPILGGFASLGVAVRFW